MAPRTISLREPQPFLHLIQAAKQQPDKLALVSATRELTYLELLTQSARLAVVLKSRGITKGDFVALATSSDLDVIFSHALWALAAIPGSYPIALSEACSVQFDWLIAHASSPHVPADRSILISSELLEEAATISEPMEVTLFDSLESTCRLLFSSGTTGTPLAIPYSINTTHQFAAYYEYCWTKTRPFFDLIPYGSAVGYYDATAAFSAGDTYLCPGTMEDNLAVIAKNYVAGLMASPVQLAALVEAAESSPGILDGLEVIFSVGSNLSPTMAKRIMHLCNCRLGSAFGTTENAAVLRGWFNEEGHIDSYERVLDDVAIEVVDDQDQECIKGRVGHIRIRNSHMPQGYLNTPATNNSFRDGWFYSGDLALEHEDGHFELAGRSSEVLNIGGVKINADAVDAAMCGVPGIKEAAVFEVEDEHGAPRAIVAFVSDEVLNSDVLHNTFSAVSQGLRAETFVQLTHLPRNHMGKVVRRELVEQYRLSSS